MDAKSNGRDEQGVSTLVLVDDTEFELHASTGSLAFPQWGSIEACGKRRVAVFSVSLTRRVTSDEENESRRGATPLVITAPLNSRFRLRPDEGSSLMALLREDTEAAPMRFFVEFVPPETNESDWAWDNFQDQVVVQTRLARLSVRLFAMRDAATMDACDPKTFQPQILPSVKAPSFKLFEQIERDASVAASAAVSDHRLSVSGSFHPQRNPTQSLAPLPVLVRQPTPPHPSLSRPSSSDGRRTASPRVLEPLASSVGSPSVSADVTNLTEAREVIRRLRARRSSQSTAVKPSEIAETVEDAAGPESRLDARAKAELDEFNALVKCAKQNVAVVMNKAKDELDFYKSLLPKQPTAERVPAFPEPSASLPIDAETNNNAPARVSGAMPKKPARLPTLASSTEERKPCGANDTNIRESMHSSSSNNNQELSPVKRIQQKAPRAQSKSKHEDEPKTPEPQPVHRQSTKPVTTTRKPPTAKPQAMAVAATVKLARMASGPQQSKATATPKTKATKSKPKPKPTKASALSAISDDALLDFDDADPEVDDAPWLPDDMQRNLADDDEDDVMLTMKVPL